MTEPPRRFLSDVSGAVPAANKQTYAEAVRLDLEIQKAVGKVSQEQIEATMARFGLKDDLGEFEGWQTVYDLDTATRDRLIAHARQDAAMAYYSSNNTKKEVRRLRRLVWGFGTAIVGLLVLHLLK